MYPEGDVIQRCLFKQSELVWYHIRTCPADTSCLADIDEASGKVIASCNKLPVRPRSDNSVWCTEYGTHKCNWDKSELWVCKENNHWELEKKCAFTGDCKETSTGYAKCEHDAYSPPKAPRDDSTLLAIRRAADPVSWGPCSQDEYFQDKCATTSSGLATILKCAKWAQGWIWFEFVRCGSGQECEADVSRAHCQYPVAPGLCQEFDKICSADGKELLACNTTAQQWFTELICTEGGSCVEDRPRRAICERGGVHPPPVRREEEEEPWYGQCTRAEYGLNMCLTTSNVTRVVVCRRGLQHGIVDFGWYEKEKCEPDDICDEDFGNSHCRNNLTAPLDPPGCEKWDKICSWDHSALMTCNVATQKYDVELICTEGGICVMDTPRRARCDRGGVEPTPPDLETPREQGKCKTFDKKCSDDKTTILACDPKTQTWSPELECKVVEDTDSKCVQTGEFTASCPNGGSRPLPSMSMPTWMTRLPTLTPTNTPLVGPTPYAAPPAKRSAAVCQPKDGVCDSTRRFLFDCDDGQWTSQPSQCFGPGWCNMEYDRLTCAGFPVYDGGREDCDTLCEATEYLYCVGGNWDEPETVRKCKENMCSHDYVSFDDVG